MNIIMSKYRREKHHLGDPVIWCKPQTDMPKIVGSSDVSAIFGTGETQRLTTWGWAEKGSKKGLHWLAVRSGKGMHTDPGFMRYTHQLVVRNDGWLLSGIDGIIYDILPGTMFCLDTHSPHKLAKNKVANHGLYYVALSLDSDEVMSCEEFASEVMREIERMRAC